MGRLSENSVLNIKNKSFSLTSEIEVGEKPANGVIIAQGGKFGGWAIYFVDGKLSWVQLDVGKDDHDHFIDPDERFRVAMARQ